MKFRDCTPVELAVKPVKLGDLNPADVIDQLRHTGIDVRVGPFVLRLQTPLKHVADGFRFLYDDFLLDHDGIADFRVCLTQPVGIRRWWRPQSVFYCNRHMPFSPFPLRLALPLMEWGLNWCVMTYANLHLNIHSAVVERNGWAAILPGSPGAGKSTLCAALVHRGWRLLSDEMALVRPKDSMLVPIPRPINLKDQSIELIRQFAPEAHFGPTLTQTGKGTVSHMRPPTESVRRANETAAPGWIIFPHYQADSPAKLEPLPKTQILLQVADHAFNYSVLGVTGFKTLFNLVDQCACYRFCYGRLDEAIAMFEALDPPANRSRP